MRGTSAKATKPLSKSLSKGTCLLAGVSISRKGRSDMDPCFGGSQ